jgi:hypothetical protein
LQVRTTPAPVGSHPTRDPRLTDTTPAARPGHPRHRRVNPNLFVPPTPYLDVVMAGVRGRFRGRQGPGRGSPADRGRIAAATGQGSGANVPVTTTAGRGGGGSSGDGRPWRPGGCSSPCDRWPWRPWGGLHIGAMAGV